MTRLRSIVSFVSVLLSMAALWAFAPSMAHADGRSPDQAFTEGRKLWEKKQCDQALPLFKEALAATGSPNARLYVGRCLHELGRLVEAYQELERTLREAAAESDADERYARTRDQAAAERAQLETQIAKLVIAVDESLAGAPVTLDGAPVAAELLNTPMAVMPGKVVVVAQAPAGAVRREVELTAGATATVTLSAPSLVVPKPVEPEPLRPAPPPPDDPGLGLVRALGIGVAAVGVGGMIAFGVGTALADKALHKLETECDDQRCTDPAYSDTVDSGKRAEIIAGVGLGFGIAGIAGGALMIVLGGADDGGDASAFVTPTVGGVVAGARF